MMLKSLTAISLINIGFALYMGFYIPTDHHELFALTARDYFLISFVTLILSMSARKRS